MVMEQMAFLLWELVLQSREMELAAGVRSQPVPPARPGLRRWFAGGLVRLGLRLDPEAARTLPPAVDVAG